MTQMDEQETTITFMRTEEKVRIYTSIPAHMRKLDKDPRATRTDAWWNGVPFQPGSIMESAAYEVSASDWNPLSFRRKSRELSEEEREALRVRLARVRAGENPSTDQEDSEK